ncbi:MAG: hypothetical protein LUG54_01665 [Clostridiales bacterium]|nr:hypothetical protein [Clostridiales bacterium]
MRSVTSFLLTFWCRVCEGPEATKHERIGAKIINHEGLLMTVTAYINWNNVDIVFENGIIVKTR